MSKLNPSSIVEADIEEYLANYSDFSFEIRVLKELKELGLICEHSGTYDDPLTGKSREFDIRALYQHSNVRVHLSVECKNIQDNFPLVVHCLKRSSNESYNDLMCNFPYNSARYGSYSFPESSEIIREENKYSLYMPAAYVAKSADQVGRTDKKAITATDGGVFDRISQAIHSAKDLISEAYDIGLDKNFENDFSVTFVCPVLVVPDSRLWQVKYSDFGDVIGHPEQINHISYYFGKEWTVGTMNPLSYKISHLEIVTFSELEKFIITYLGGYMNCIKSSFNRLQAK